MNKNWFRFVVVIYFFLSIPPSFAATVRWTPVESTENCVIAGYKIHYGTTSGDYTQVVDVGNAASYDLDMLGLVSTQTYFFAVNAYSTTNQDGPLSSSTSYTESPNIVAYPSIDYDKNTIDVTYNENNMQGADVKDNYEFSPTILFDAAYEIVRTDRTYRLFMNYIPEHTIVTMTVSGITDSTDHALISDTIVLNDNDNNNLADDWESYSESNNDENSSGGSSSGGSSGSSSGGSSGSSSSVTSPNESITDDTNSFVTRFYDTVLGRTPDPSGLDYWVSELQNGNFSGEDLANSFIISEEFTNINTSDDEYVEILYQSFFNRASDTGGYNYWMTELSIGTDRVDILNCFVRSLEFNDLCDFYGINPQNTNTPETEISQFVTRFYEECLSRSPDSSDLAYWVEQLQNKTQTAKTLVNSFIFNVESENTTDDEFITILYQALFNRAPDTGGYNNWMNELSLGTNRSTVLNYFTESAEFITWCNTNGIMPY